MNQNKEGIDKLRNIIYSTLDPLITGNYCLLDIPDHVNIGDSLIWAGELAYLERLPYVMEYTANLYLCEEDKINPETIILLHGGGNFGDVWRHGQEFRNNIITKFPNNKIIVFPQTVYYENENILLEDAQIFNAHKNLYICARDQQSYDILTSKFYNNQILLLPDMAFCLDLDKYITNATTNKSLLFKRTDKELNKNNDSGILNSMKQTKKEIDVLDWPTFKTNKLDLFVDDKLYSIERRLAYLFLKLPVFNKLVDSRYALWGKNNLEKYLKIGIDFINEYDEVYTTRLHGYILSILLNKKVHMMDNSYGKNSRTYNTWMKDFKNSSLIK